VERHGCSTAIDRLFRRFPGRHRSICRRAGRNHKVVAVRELPGDHDVYCLTVPEAGNFALEAGVFVRNCGIIVNVTPLEPEWEGYVTLEFSNTTPLPAKIYANEGVAQVIFFESDEVCETSYKDRGGKYQGQQRSHAAEDLIPGADLGDTATSFEGHSKVASVSIIAICQVAAMALWFSASAIVPALVAEYGLSGFAQAALTSGVQAGFVLVAS
jgi:hypothetical protein